MTEQESLKDVCMELNIVADCTLIRKGACDEQGRVHDLWSCRLSYNGREMLVSSYKTGTGLRKEKRLGYGTVCSTMAPVKPEAYEIIGSMLISLSATEQSFKSWASDFGCNEDPWKTIQTYFACQEEADKVSRFIASNEILNRLRNAEY